MKNNWKRIISLILAILMVASFMVACGGGGAATTSRSKKSTTKATDDPALVDGVPENVDYKGATVRLFTRNNKTGTEKTSDAEYLLLEFKGNPTMNAKLNDAIMKRNDEVEGRLGITLDITAEPGLIDGNDSCSAWLNKMKAAATSENGNDLFDIAAIYASQGSAFAVQGCFLDVNLLPEGTIDLDKVWWNQSLQEELEIDGSLFMLGGDISLSSSALACAIFYNKSLFAEYFANDFSEGGFQETFDYVPHDEREGVTLYDIVKEYEWTLDVFSDLSSKIHIDKGTSGRDKSDTFGLVIDKCSNFDAWIPALNIQFIDKNTATGEVKLAFAEVDGALRHANNVYNDIHDLITTNTGVWTFDSGEGAIEKFADGEGLFIMCRLCDAESFRNIDDWDYGILPLPKYENDTSEYATLPANHYSLIVVAANLTDDRAEMVGYTLELLAAESYKLVTPEYYNSVLKSDYSDRPEDADMYDIVIRNIQMEFATIYSTVSLASIAMPIRMGGNSFSTEWSRNDGKYQDALETLIAGLKLQAELQKGTGK